MPTYQYVCTDCTHPLEAQQSFSDPALTDCPQCEGRLRKVFSAVGVVFKGSGFYRNDSRAAQQGSDRDGDTRSKDGGTNERGSKDGGTNESGSKDGGSNESGSKDGGPKEGGPKKEPSASADAGSAASGSGSAGSGSGRGSSSAGSSGRSSSGVGKDSAA